MSYRTVLVYLDSLEQASGLLGVAVQIAHQHNAHLIGLYVVPPLQLYVSAEIPVPAEMTQNHIAYHRDLANSLKTTFESVTRSQDFVSEWREITSVPLSVSDTICEISHTVDLVVLSQKDSQENSNAHADLPDRVLLGASRPVLVVPSDREFQDIGSDIFVAWDGKSESTRAVFDALPVLRKADNVIVHRVNPEHFERHRLLSTPAELVNTLSRHGVNVTLSQSNASNHEIGEELLQYVRDRGCNLMVMGAYGHARLREILFGGTTRKILQEMSVPVLMSH